MESLKYKVGDVVLLQNNNDADAVSPLVSEHWGKEAELKKPDSDSSFPYMAVLNGNNTGVNDSDIEGLADTTEEVEWDL